MVAFNPVNVLLKYIYNVLVTAKRIVGAAAQVGAVLDTALAVGGEAHFGFRLLHT